MSKYVFTEEELKQIEILEKYHQVDREKKIVTVELHYSTVSELLQEDTSTNEKPMFSKDIMGRIGEVIDLFPANFKLDLHLKIDDYEEYDEKVIYDSFLNLLEIEQYHTNKEVNKSWGKAAVFFLIGAALLIVLNILYATGAIGETKLTDRIMDYFLDCCACVFIWEAIGMVAAYPSEYILTNKKMYAFLHAVSFYNKKDKFLYGDTLESISKDWSTATTSNKVGKIFLITTGSLHIVLGTILLVNFLVEINKVTFDTPQFIAYIVLTACLATLEIIYGIGSLSRYLGRGPFKKFVFLLSFILVITYIVGIVLVVINVKNGKEIPASVLVNIIISFAATILNFIGCIFTRTKKKQIVK